jgi:hypothetical protein
MRPDTPAMKQMNRNVGRLVANHFTKQVRVFGFEEDGMDGDLPRCGFTTPE